MKKYLLEPIVFICGAVIMIFELAGSRVLGPFFGTSIFVWTSLIGIIMGSLSIGYWLGGKISDKKPSLLILSWIIVVSAIFILFTSLGQFFVLRTLPEYIQDFRLRSVIASIILFSVPSILLGMVTPYVVKLKIKKISTSGTTVGNLYAISTIGSIAGTFFAGFYLIPEFGNSNILFFISILLTLISLTVFILYNRKISCTLSIFLICIIGFFYYRNNNKEKEYIDVDTQYNRVIIYNTIDKNTDKPIKMLNINNEKSAAMFLDNDELVFEVLKYYRLAEHFNPGFKKSLMIGGSGYSFPKDYLKKFPLSELDVVEIDPKLTELAKEHFKLKQNQRLKIYHEDGRTFLNRTQNKYDVVYMDAYKSLITIPYQLTTKEAIQKIYNVLNNNGVVFANIISAIGGKNNLFLQAE